MRYLTFAALLLPAVSHARSNEEVSPLEKVTSMLDDMLKKGKAEKHNEQVEFAKFQAWCDGTRAAAKKGIETAAAKIVQLKADIGKAQADAESLAAEINDLQGSIAGWQSSLKQATAIRDKELADYTAEHTDLSESITALASAHAVVEQRMKDVPQSMLQVDELPDLPLRAKAAFDAFIQLAGPPQANAYEAQSGGILKMFEDLRIKFEDQRLALEKEEMTAKANFDLLAQKLTDDIKAASTSVSSKTSTKAKRQEDAAVAKGDLSATEAAKKQDHERLETTTTDCRSGAAEFESNQGTRADEIKAIEGALSILRSDDVSGNNDKYLSLVQQHVAHKTALLQIRSSGSLEARQHVAAFLQSHAKHSGSRYLMLAAEQVATDPFGKIKKMIQDMIFKIMEDATAEADHKAYCDAELAVNKQTRDIKSSKADELTAAVEKQKSTSGRLASELQAVSGDVAEMRKALAEALEIRNAEKATNAQTIKDAKAAQLAVEKATQVLRDFYGKKKEAVLLQDGEGLAEEMSQAAKAPYSGMGAESGGVIGFLEVILSDFARLEAETSSAEDAAAENFKRFAAESEEDMAVKLAEISHKENKLRESNAAIASLQKELELTQDELDAANAYWEKLKPDCDFTVVESYEDRVARRKEEIQSLKEALTMLDQS